MSLFHLHTHETREKPEGEESRLASTILLLVAALLIWSVLSRPLQFDGATQHCVYYGRAGAECSAGPHNEAPEPSR